MVCKEKIQIKAKNKPKNCLKKRFNMAPGVGFTLLGTNPCLLFPVHGRHYYHRENNTTYSKK